MYTLNELLDSYINGNIGLVRTELNTNQYNFADFFLLYLTEYKPDTEQQELFIRRLAYN